MRHYIQVIQSFGNTEAEHIAARRRVPSLHPNVQKIAQRKIVALDAAENLNDLRVPPGNRLEKLHGDREGQHSVRINDQWRFCFTWSPAGPEHVEFTDYH